MSADQGGRCSASSNELPCGTYRTDNFVGDITQGDIGVLSYMVLLVLSQLPPGPLDGFRANYASIQAEMDFECTQGSFVDEQRLWEGRVPNYVENHAENRDLTIVGHWACDGAAEYCRSGSPEEVLDRASKDKLERESGKVFFKVLFREKMETLWDGEVVCEHFDHPHYRNRVDNPGWRTGARQGYRR